MFLNFFRAVLRARESTVVEGRISGRVLLRLPLLDMGRVFLRHPGGLRIYSCAHCDTPLTNRAELVSTVSRDKTISTFNKRARSGGCGMYTDAGTDSITTAFLFEFCNASLLTRLQRNSASRGLLEELSCSTKCKYTCQKL